MRLAIERSLCAELAAWCLAQGLPYESADELLLSLQPLEPGLDTDQRRTQREWLSDYVTRWDAAVANDSRVDGWIVAREEKHVDAKFWVCTDRADALKIAEDVSKYWIENYGLDESELDREIFEGDESAPARIWQCVGEDAFYVYVQAQQIRARGDTEQ